MAGAADDSAALGSRFCLPLSSMGLGRSWFANGGAHWMRGSCGHQVTWAAKKEANRRRDALVGLLREPLVATLAAAPEVHDDAALMFY